MLGQITSYKKGRKGGEVCVHIIRRESLPPRETDWSFSPGNFSLKLFSPLYVVWGMKGGCYKQEEEEVQLTAS